MDFEDKGSMVIIIGGMLLLIFIGLAIVRHNRGLMRMCLEEGHSEFTCEWMVRY